MRQRPDSSAGRPSAPTSPTTPAAAMEGGALPPLLRLPPTVRPPQPQPQPPPQPSSPMSPSDSPSSRGPPPQLQPPPQHASTASVASASGPALGGDPSARSSASSVIFGSPTLSDAGGDGISPGGLGPERVLRAGDTLLLLVPDSWVQAQRLGNSFALLGRVARYAPAAAKDGGGGGGIGGGGGGGGGGDGSTERSLKLGASTLALLLLLSLSSLSIVSLFPLAVILAYFLVGAGCITLGQAWRSIGYRLILTIACSFGPGRALTNTGVSAVIGAALVELQVLGPWGFLLCIYLVTSALSCLVSNSATVVALYSVLREVRAPGVNAQQLMISMMLGASSAFATPIGYQTNLMVIGRGGYVFRDFMALGGGLTLVVGCCVASSALLFL